MYTLTNLFRVMTKFGPIYIEQPSPDLREDPYHIKIYDSTGTYLDKISVDDMTEVDVCREWVNYVSYLCNANEFNVLLNKLVNGDENWCYHSDNINDVLDMMLELKEWNSFRKEVLESLMENFGAVKVTTKAEEEHIRYLFEQNEWINFIGKEIVLMYEY